ncbi:N-methyl-L-tryptophan oxidase [Brevibacillus dissolubilis]|uniref:N-methyl-L-tryptophan oxidase n=1 Tax=Brevibacillus dissolubilis TaxID=1844116 RepID=UPI001116CDBE|nr:N-methyl-L-tryptophan oxidase [Brevibacillus dissolubilis]
MNQHFEVIVIGAGSVGMAAGYYLSEQGVSTLLIDSYDPPHENGSHHGNTRIIRHAYGDCKSTMEDVRKQPYIPLSLQANKLYLQLDARVETQLFYPSGLLDIARADSSRLAGVIQTANAFDIPIEVLTADEINHRWPGLQVPEGYIGVLELRSGTLMCDDIIRAYRDLAITQGAVLQGNTPVRDIQIHSDGVTVTTDEATYTADKVIVCAGGWTEKLVRDAGIRFQHIRKTVALFAADEALYDVHHFPAFFFDLGAEQYYSLPSVNGMGLKVGRHDAGQEFDITAPLPPFGSYPEDMGEIGQFMAAHMRVPASQLIKGGTCQYTMTADEDFIVDFHPEHRHVMVAAGLAGHGFKFASVLGQKLGQMAVTGERDEELAIFSIGRPGLQDKVRLG